MENEILELLRSGKTMDEIIASLGKELTNAEETYKAEVAAKREKEEKAAREKEEATKREEMREYLAGEVVRALANYFDELHPGLIDFDMEPDEMAKNLDMCAKMMKTWSKFDSEDLNDIINRFMW